MTKWSMLKAAGLFSVALPVLGGFSCVSDLLQDVLVAVLFD